MKSNRSFRRGSAYVALLGTSMLVSVIGVAAVLAARVQLRAATRRADTVEARLYARAAVDVGRLLISTDSSWRTTRSNGSWIASQPVGTGSLSIEGIDPVDGNLGNRPTDPVVLTGKGVKGGSRHFTQVTLDPQVTPLDSLATAVTARDDISFDDGTLLSAGNTVATNGSFFCSGTCTIDAQVEADGSITGGKYYGTRKSATSSRTLPASTVFDSYVTNGTAISYSTINGKVEDVVLSPASNPFGGSTNPQGIYVIDCQNQAITIKNCRIVGTLVLLNARAGSVVDGSVNMSPAVANFPTLLVKGPMRFIYATTKLTEDKANLNPPGTPYEGVSNSTNTDVYPSLIRGLVYVSGDLDVSNNLATIEGVLLVGGALNCKATLAVNYDQTYLKNPPAGFCTIGAMQIRRGSWRQIVE